MTPSVSVILCAYTMKRWDCIVAAVQSLRDQRTPAHEVILVIDHNQDLLQRAAEAFPDARVMANTGEQGLSGARNTGVYAATGEIVAFLDDDAAADPDWLAELLDTYSDEDVLGVGGYVEPRWEEGDAPSWLPAEFYWVVGCSYIGQPTRTAPVRNAIGANMSFRRQAVLDADGFSSKIGRVGADAAGCEETELSIRVAGLRPGGKILLNPAAKCTHLVTEDRQSFSYFRRRCAAEGRSKAVVSELAGASSALSSESAYVKHTLPAGVGRHLVSAGRGDLAGVARAATIVVGLAVTAGNYGWTRARMSTRTQPPSGNAK